MVFNLPSYVLQVLGNIVALDKLDSLRSHRRRCWIGRCVNALLTLACNDSPASGLSFTTGNDPAALIIGLDHATVLA